MRGSHIQNPTRAVTMATAAGALVATATMSLPVTMSFAIPAPVPAEVKAIIAFGLGAMTLIGAMGVWLGRSKNDQDLFQKFGQPIEDFAQSTERSRGHLAINMPSHQNADARSSPVNLKRFQLDAVHPDGGPIMMPDDVPHFIPPDEIAPDFDVPLASEVPPPLYERSPGQRADSSIADMIDEFETAVAHRHQKLAELSESIVDNMPEATNLASGPNANDSAPSDAGDSRRPILELVASAPVKDDDADSALAAALATLERITVRAR